jgi:hypothetical protein
MVLLIQNDRNVEGYMPDVKILREPTLLLLLWGGSIMVAGGVRASLSGEVVVGERSCEIGDCKSGGCIETPFVDNGVLCLRLSELLPWLPVEL